MRGNCIHCGEFRPLRARQLCTPCYMLPDIRAIHPSKIGNGNGPTLAELDALVAERMKNLPRWWKDEAAKIEGALNRRGRSNTRSRKGKSHGRG